AVERLHLPKELLNEWPVSGRDERRQRAPDQFADLGAEYGVRGAGGGDDGAVTGDLDQQVGGGEGERDMAVAFQPEMPQGLGLRRGGHCSGCRSVGGWRPFPPRRSSGLSASGLPCSAWWSCMCCRPGSCTGLSARPI